MRRLRAGSPVDAAGPVRRLAAGYCLACALVSGCATSPFAPVEAAYGIRPTELAPGDGRVELAQLAAQAAVARTPQRRNRLLFRCVRIAQDMAGAGLPDPVDWHNRCSNDLLVEVFRARPRGWSPGRTSLAGIDVDVRFEGQSTMFRGAFEVTAAVDVPLAGGQGFGKPGFGLPVVLRTDRRCDDDARCALYPTEGIYEWATAWVEYQESGPVLRIINPARAGSIVVGGSRVSPAFDAFAFYRLGAIASRLPRQGVYGLLGGAGARERAGVYLLQDYDPHRTPVVMIHGLGSNPIIWSDLSGAIWADGELRGAYQVVHVVFQTNAPLLVSRRRVQQYLDRMWQLLDPEGDDPARAKMVLVGHSLGGVVARLLTVDSGETLWNAAFTIPPSQMQGGEADVAGIRSTFLTGPYPGACAVVMLAAPHKGSPRADSFTGRLARALVGRRAPEIQALRRIASVHPDWVNPALLDSYRLARLNSITTLQTGHPVRKAGEQLLPVSGVRYHTIAGDLGGRGGDGVVPLGSALFPGAHSTLVLDAGHTLYREPAAIARVLAILREERRRPCDTPRVASPGSIR